MKLLVASTGVTASDAKTVVHVLVARGSMYEIANMPHAATQQHATQLSSGRVQHKQRQQALTALRKPTRCGAASMQSRVDVATGQVDALQRCQKQYILSLTALTIWAHTQHCLRNLVICRRGSTPGQARLSSYGIQHCHNSVTAAGGGFLHRNVSRCCEAVPCLWALQHRRTHMSSRLQGQANAAPYSMHTQLFAYTQHPHGLTGAAAHTQQSVHNPACSAG